MPQSRKRLEALPTDEDKPQLMLPRSGFPVMLRVINTALRLQPLGVQL
jgi:hypothetical protein